MYQLRPASDLNQNWHARLPGMLTAETQVMRTGKRSHAGCAAFATDIQARFWLGWCADTIVGPAGWQPAVSPLSEEVKAALEERKVEDLDFEVSGLKYIGEEARVRSRAIGLLQSSWYRTIWHPVSAPLLQELHF